MSVAITSCRDCGHACFPPRLLCPRCGGGAWAAGVVSEGVVSGATTVARRVDAAAAAPVHLAEVRSDAGVVVLARLEHPARAGLRVRLRKLPSGAILGAIMDEPSAG